uniref:Uncharacterized protein n=1 Tax=Rhizophora mucronata TaxID=61149 RepID=A0A2P2QRZ6_RHIMU
MPVNNGKFNHQIIPIFEYQLLILFEQARKRKLNKILGTVNLDFNIFMEVMDSFYHALQLTAITEAKTCLKTSASFIVFQSKIR